MGYQRRVHGGVLEFDNGGGARVSGVFDTMGFRVSLQFGGELPVAAMIASTSSASEPALAHVNCFQPRWTKHGPVTEPQPLKYGRTVSDDGTYMARFTCDFDEAIDLPWPPPQSQNTGIMKMSADIWLERRSAIEKLDGVLSLIGLGNDLPEYEHTWLGRAIVCLPQVGQDCVAYRWPVHSDRSVKNE